MRDRQRFLRAFLLTLCTGIVGFANPVVWTDWTFATPGSPGSASGSMGNVSVSYSGEISFAQTAGGTNYWIPDSPYLSGTVSNAPPDPDIVALVGGNAIVNTITFGDPVVNPIMAIVSLGRPGLLVEYLFDRPFDVLSFGPGFWGGPGTLTELAGNILQGEEGHGAIQFQGTVSSISWTVPIAEYWHGFSVGVTAIPEPGTWALALIGIGLTACIRRVVRR